MRYAEEDSVQKEATEQEDGAIIVQNLVLRKAGIEQKITNSVIQTTRGKTMTKVDDGGPAFPCEQIAYLEGQKETHDNPNPPPKAVWKNIGGMTLRQFYAAAALQGLLAARIPENTTRKDAAKHCFKWADEMIAAEKGEIV